ncbi:MAG: D-alanine--D-alanine ligase [Pseudomonadaceae bacterium]|nr:D-alanine--D-alanine ligase [Pseudomonadaceae bacterium]
MPEQTLRVAVLMGGASAEAQVSRNSAQQVAEALLKKGHECHLVELDESCMASLLDLAPDAVFPALHGPPGEDGTVQGMLEMSGLPYVGSRVRGSAMAMDKAVAKHIFRQADLPVAADLVVTPEDNLQATSQQILKKLGPAVVIKPLNQGSAIGVIPLPNGGDLPAALEQALIYGNCLVEPFVLGKEITVGVLQVGQKLLAHPVIEIITADAQWYDYENRYTPGQSEHLIPAPLPDGVTQQLQKIAVRAHQALDLRDLSRADFIVTDNGEITLLEVNTLPGMTPVSLYPEGAEAIGYPFAQLVDHLVRQAVQRGADLVLDTS